MRARAPPQYAEEDAVKCLGLGGANADARANNLIKRGNLPNDHRAADVVIGGLVENPLRSSLRSRFTFLLFPFSLSIDLPGACVPKTQSFSLKPTPGNRFRIVIDLPIGAGLTI